MLSINRRSFSLTALGACGACLLLPGNAGAYVRTRASETNLPLAWKCPNVTLRILPATAPDSVSAELFGTAAAEAASQWNKAGVSCTNLAIQILSSSERNAFVEADSLNYIHFRTDFWGRNARGEQDRTPYPQNALAITSVFANRRTGQIVDAHVEINATSAMWGDMVANPALLNSPNTHDLQNTLTHEFGHVIGLDHTCDGGGQTSLVDNENKAVPPCPGSPDIQETTMSATVVPGDTLRRTLASDDRKGLCEVYPAAGVVPRECPPVTEVDGGVMPTVDAGVPVNMGGSAGASQGGQGGLDALPSGGSSGAGGKAGSGEGGSKSDDGGCSFAGGNARVPSGLLAVVVAALLWRRRRR